MRKPKQLKEPDFSELKELCQEYIDGLQSGEIMEDNDYSEYIFEKALMCIFGENVFDWVNKKIV